MKTEDFDKMSKADGRPLFRILAGAVSIFMIYGCSIGVRAALDGEWEIAMTFFGPGILVGIPFAFFALTGRYRSMS